MGFALADGVGLPIAGRLLLGPQEGGTPLEGGIHLLGTGGTGRPRAAERDRQRDEHRRNTPDDRRASVEAGSTRPRCGIRLLLGGHAAFDFPGCPTGRSSPANLAPFPRTHISRGKAPGPIRRGHPRLSPIIGRGLAGQPDLRNISLNSGRIAGVSSWRRAAKRILYNAIAGPGIFNPDRSSAGL